MTIYVLLNVVQKRAVQALAPKFHLHFISIMTDLSNWKGCPVPDHKVLHGEYCTLEPFDMSSHAEPLYAAAVAPGVEERYRWLPSPAPRDFSEFKHWMEGCINNKEGNLFYSVVDKRTGVAEGRLALISVDPANGSIEFGQVQWGPRMERSQVSTEAFYLCADYVFSLGYRRLVWRCNERNEPSKRAAVRLGFQYEGTFRNHMVLKGANRNTCWYSILDTEWPEVRKKFVEWLSPANFENGVQKTKLNAAAKN